MERLPEMIKQKLQSAWPILLIFGLALLVRVIYNLTVAYPYTPHNDSAAYQALAFHLLDEHVYAIQPYFSNVSRAPLWPLIIAALSLIFGRENIVDRLFLSLIDAGTCVLIYLFARTLFQRWPALLAALFACIYTAMYIYTGWMYTETLFTFLLMAVCFCVLLIQRHEKRRWWLVILCGVLLALLSLTRPNGVLMIGLVILSFPVLFWRKMSWRRMAGYAGVMALVSCLLIVPWTIRNYLASGHFVLIATGDGTVLLGSYNDQSIANQGHWLNPASVYPQQYVRDIPNCNAACGYADEERRKAAALAWIEAHPRSLPRLMVLHLQNFFKPYSGEADSPLSRFPYQKGAHFVLNMSQTLPSFVFALAALGFLTTLRKYWRELFFVYLAILATVVEALVYYGSPRFRAPIEPLLLLLSAGAIWWLARNAPGTLRHFLQRRFAPRQVSRSADVDQSLS